MKNYVFLIMLTFSFINISAQKFDQLSQTPPMGWNSWNKFQTDISEKLVMETADAMVANGMKEAGYEYIVIDDGWQVDRNENGKIVVDKKRFPNGIKYLADYVHSKGLKFGIYSCAGTKTCDGRPGSRGYEFQDARTYASWGVDYLKYDWCYTTTQNPQASYEIMRDALFKAGRPIVFSLCEWGQSKPWEWAKDVGHLWRTTGDIVDRWDAMISIFDKQKQLSEYAGPGHWNDPDMLEVGNGGMTFEEYKTHFSLWCILAAPLMAGNDFRDMDDETLEILTNREMIAVNQDTLGEQAFCFRDNGDYEVWLKKLAGGEKAICLLNRGDEVKTVEVNLKVLLKANDFYWATEPYEVKDYYLRDLWSHENMLIKENTMDVTLQPHTVKVYRFIKKQE